MFLSLDRSLPVSFVLLLASLSKRSVNGARMPSKVPNIVLSPKLSSMRKNRADQKGLPGSSVIASVNAIKARPVPSTPSTNTMKTVRHFLEEF